MSGVSVRWKQIVGARAEQQDACGVSDAAAYARKGLLAALADGMGGLERGADFSRAAIRAMLSRFASGPAMADPCAELLQLYAAAQEAAAGEQREESEGGATLVAALVRDGRCAFLSAGDSRIYLLREGRALLLNREQSLGRVLDERVAFGRLPPEEARYNTRRRALTNYLGCRPPKPPDRNATAFALRGGDRLLLMSDGVFGTLADDALEALCGLAPDEAPARVLDAVAAAGKPGQDNASIMVLAIH